MTTTQQFPPVYELLDAEGIERLHQAALTILRDFGIAFEDQETCEILNANGVQLQGNLARFDGQLIERCLATTPRTFTQLARNPRNHVTIGGGTMVLAPVYGAPFVHDHERGRRPARLEDFRNFVKLAQLSPHLNHSGGVIAEPTDRPLATRHLDMLMGHIELSDRPFMGSALGAQTAADSVAMAEILFGAADIRRQPALLSLINVNSPRRFDARMLGALKVYARARQAVMITPFSLAGAMAPVTIAGALALQHAEVLAGLALVQLIEPGAPVVYGSFLVPVNMQNALPMFGSPPSQPGLFASAQLARRCGMPFRGGGTLTNAKVPDAQAAYESMVTMSATMMAKTDFVLHAAGWLDGGLTAGYEKFMLDCEIAGVYRHWERGLDLSPNALALDAVEATPPGGQFFDADHTLAHFRNACAPPRLFDNNHYEGWCGLGAKDSTMRAAEVVKSLLASYEPPPLDAAIAKELATYIRRRKDPDMPLA